MSDRRLPEDTSLDSSSEGESEDEVLKLERSRLIAAATHRSRSVIVEIALDNTVSWVSPSWLDIIGESPAGLVGQPISTRIAGAQEDLFAAATDSLLRDGTKSARLRFWLSLTQTSSSGLPQALEIDSHGILIHDRTSGEPSHTMWVFSLVENAQVFVGELEAELAEDLAGGAEVLAKYVQTIGPDTIELMPPDPLRCNICDRNISPWFFERHTSLCIVSHKAESEAQESQDQLLEQRRILSDLIANLACDPYNATYNGRSIVAKQALTHKSPGSLLQTASRQRSESQRQTQLKFIEHLLDYCDVAIDVSLPALSDQDLVTGNMRIHSPDSQARISQLRTWTMPESTNDALCDLKNSITDAVQAKVAAVVRLHDTIHYSEMIRQEVDAKVQELIERTLMGNVDSDSTDVDEQPNDLLLGTSLSPQQASLSRSAVESREPFVRRDLHSPSIGSPLSSGSYSPNREACQQATQSTFPDPHAAVERASSPLAQGAQLISRHLSVLSSSPTESGLPFSESDLEGSSRAASVRSTSENEGLVREGRKGLYDIPRRPSGKNRAPTGFSPSRRGSRAMSRSRNASLARDRTASPGRRSASNRLAMLEHERSSPMSSPVLGPSDASADYLSRERRLSVAAPLSPRLSSVAPAGRPAPPSIKDFEIIKPISRGAFGSVYLSKKKLSGDYYAIKVLKKADMIAKNQVTNIKAERAIMMAQTESPFIAKLYYTFQSKEYLYLVMEYLNGGDCAALIRQLGGLPEDWTRRYLSEVVLGLEYLHARGIIHRDLKPDNLLISQSGHLKLTDFGLSRVGLIGRQNRARQMSHPDPLDLVDYPTSQRESSFSYPSNISSRSTSFDFANSAISTPAALPGSPIDMRLDRGYFGLRSRTGSNSESGSDALSSAITKLSLDEPCPSPEDELNRKSPVIAGSNAMPPPPMRLYDPHESGYRKFVGTPDYLAPETITGHGQDDMVDWWSLGVICFEFLYGYPPFHADTPDIVFDNILARRIDWPSIAAEEQLDVSQHAKDLMVRLMCLNPAERLGSLSGATDVKRHTFFERVVWDRISEEQPLFVPTPDNPEDTDYFDARGATEHVFDDEPAPFLFPAVTDPAAIAPASLNRSIMPLAIPAHVRARGRQGRRASEPERGDSFGSFTFKNLPVLEKQNLDVIKRLRDEHGTVSNSGATNEHQRSMSIAVPRPPSSSSLSGAALSPAQRATRLRQGSSPQSTSASSAILSSSPSTRLHQRPQRSFQFEYELGSPSGLSKSRRRSRAYTLSGQLPHPELLYAERHEKQRHRHVFDSETPSSASDTEEYAKRKRFAKKIAPTRTTAMTSGSRAQKIGSPDCRNSSHADAAEERQRKRLDVLVCEDNPVSRRVLEAMLQKLRCRVVSVTDGAQCVAAANADVQFDMIFTDIRMPRLSGVEAAKLIQSSSLHNARTPIVAMSSYSTKDIPGLSYFGARLEKPLTMETVCKTLEELCHGWTPPSVKK
ncbi:rim15, signal transduction response regulator [Savitreella phatthalungensis]